jgi:hypothetical protein
LGASVLELEPVEAYGQKAPAQTLTAGSKPASVLDHGIGFPQFFEPIRSQRGPSYQRNGRRRDPFEINVQPMDARCVLMNKWEISIA